MIHIMVFLGVITAVGMSALLLPKPEVSEFEGRELVKFPKFSWADFFSGKYTRQIGTHFSDTFPGRDFLVAGAAVYKDSLGVHVDDVKIHGNVPNTKPDPDVQVTVPAPVNPAETPSGEVTAPVTEEEAPVEMDGEMKEGVFVVGDKAMSLFGGSKSMGQYYANVISGYQGQFGSHVQIYNIVVPTQAEFALPKKYQDLSASQKDNIDHIYESLSPAIKHIDAYSKLKEHRNEYIYFRTDHHWTPLGAYYAYEAFCEEAGFNPVPISSMETRSKESFLGSLYRITQEPALKANPDFMDYYVTPNQNLKCTFYKKGQRNTPYSAELYVEYASGTNTYSLFMGGDWPLFEIDTGLNTGRSVLIVKESFGNAFVPYLTNHYDKVYVVDQRYFEKNLVQFVADNSIGEVIFINNVFAANTDSQINWIKNLNQEKPWPVVTTPAPETPDVTDETPLEGTTPPAEETPETEPSAVTEPVPVTPSEEEVNEPEPPEE